MKIWTNDRSSNVHTQRTPLEHRWKAHDEIYKIYILLHRSDLEISAKNRQHFFANEKMNFCNFRFFHCLRRILQFFCEIFMKFCPDFAINSRKE